MLFHALWLIYTAKELDSHAKHGQSLKKRSWMYDGVFLVFQFSFNMALCDVIKFLVWAHLQEAH